LICAAVSAEQAIGIRLLFRWISCMSRGEWKVLK